ncbi:unnamed protein product [Discosporangium mesarthrocarpum]
MLTSWNILEAVDVEGDGALKSGQSLGSDWTSSEHALPITCVHVGLVGGRAYTASLDRTAKVWESLSGQLLLSVAFPTFLRTVTTDPAEAFMFAGGAGGVIYQVCMCWPG